MTTVYLSYILWKTTLYIVNIQRTTRSVRRTSQAGCFKVFQIPNCTIDQSDKTDVFVYSPDDLIMCCDLSTRLQYLKKASISNTSLTAFLACPILRTVESWHKAQLRILITWHSLNNGISAIVSLILKRRLRVAFWNIWWKQLHWIARF